MERIGDLLEPTLKQMGVRGRVRDVQLATALAEILGPSLASLCRPVELKRGTLVVATAHGALAHQLLLDSPRLIESLNAALCRPAVRRLRFTALAGPTP